MTDWRTQHLGNLIEVGHGFAFLGEHFAEDGPYILLTPGNFHESGGFRDRGEKQKYYTGPFPHEFILKPGELLVAMTEQGEGLLGSAAFVPEGKPCLHNQRLGRVKLRSPSESDLGFIYYLFNSSSVRAQIRASATGTKVRHTSPSRIAAVEISIPPLPIQRRIASILGAYDDLIEVNRRRIAVLEKMARRLFDEWFVNFRFPGHEGHEIVDTGPKTIPDGWTMQPLEALTNYISRGIAPAYDDEAPGLVINQKCIRDGRLSLNAARRQRKAVPPVKVVQAGDILVNSTGTGTLGRIAQVEEVPPGTTVDSHVTIIRPRREVDRDFLGTSVLRLQSLFESMAVGATNQMELNRSRIASTEVVVPHGDLAVRFGAVVRPIRVLAHKLERQSNGLTASRDLLLPRLISGELSVATAERELEDAA